jgi:hypothetical protein
VRGKRALAQHLFEGPPVRTGNEPRGGRGVWFDNRPVGGNLIVVCTPTRLAGQLGRFWGIPPRPSFRRSTVSNLGQQSGSGAGSGLARSPAVPGAKPGGLVTLGGAGA